MANNLLKCEVSANSNVIKIFTPKKTQDIDERLRFKRNVSEDGQKSTGRWTSDENYAFVKGNNLK
jgi:hypothetical protein